MAGPPSYPRSDEAPERRRSNSKLVIAGVALLIAVIVILHLTGVIGPGIN